MRWTCGIGFTESVDTEYRPPGGHCGVELVRMVGQEENPIRLHVDGLGNRFVRGAFTLVPGNGQIEPAADQRGQLAAAGMGEPILLIANRTR